MNFLEIVKSLMKPDEWVKSSNTLFDEWKNEKLGVRFYFNTPVNFRSSKHDTTKILYTPNCLEVLVIYCVLFLKWRGRGG